MRFFAALAFAALMLVSPARADEKLFQEISALAEKGNAEAQYYQALSYDLGDGVGKDVAKAFALYTKAAELGDPLANYALGRFHAQGVPDLKIAKDKDKALGYFLIAAKAGYALGQSSAGVLLDAAKDPTGIEWLQKAAEQGDPVALNKLGMKHRFGRGFKKDPAEAYIYFRKVAIVTGQMKNPQAVIYLLNAMKRLPEADQSRAEKHLVTWKPQPTALTVRAEQGLKAAEALVAAAK